MAVNGITYQVLSRKRSKYCSYIQNADLLYGYNKPRYRIILKAVEYITGA